MAEFHSESISDEWRRAFDWIESELGGRIVRAERQPRWRAAWWLDLERDGATLPLYFRGERPATQEGVYSLEREAKIFQVLEAHGIPVPHVHAFCPEPRGIVMDRSPGRANLDTAESPAEREAVMDHYVELLARMHAIDVSAFEAIGMKRPTTAEELGLVDLDVWEKGYRAAKQRPEPALEFLLGWVRRNVPRDRDRVSFICCDAGQFVFDAGRVTAVLDLELACLGDPAADFGGMRGRDLSEPLGDLRRATRRYEEITGGTLDPSVVGFHAVRFNLVTPLALAHLVAAAPPGIDLPQYLAWYLVWTRVCFDLLAHRLSVTLEPPALPPAEPPAVGAEAPTPADYAAYEADTARRLEIYREREARLGPDLRAADVADVAALLGGSYADRDAADRALEEFVASAPPERDADLVRLFHRRFVREESLLEPVMRELAGVEIQIF